jgi:hypothetical protein
VRAALACLLCVLVSRTAVAAAQTPEPISLPVVLHVLEGADEARVAALVDTMGEAYAPAGIVFVVTRTPLAEERRWLHTIRERRSLARLLVPHVINVFLVDHADDPHPSESTRRTAEAASSTPSGHLGGAHVPAPGHHPSTYVIVTFDGSRSTLAHEMGHVLGAGHSVDPESIMSYGRDRHRFEDRLLTHFRARARRLVSRELRMPAR